MVGTPRPLALAALALLLLPAAGPVLALENVPEVPAVPAPPLPPGWPPAPPAVPAPPAAPQVQPAPPPAPCDLPDCALAAATPLVDEAERGVGPWVRAFEPLVALAIPDSANDLLLSGEGQATVTLNNRTAPCGGQSFAVIEASRKSFNLEPSMTIAYSGATSDQAGFLLPCLMGQRAQPGFRDLQPGSVFPDGPWTAVKRAADHVWTLSVGAADAQGVHQVEYYYTSPDGSSRASFHGAMLDYR